MEERENCLCFAVEGEPMGQPRPRMTTISGHVRSYDPKVSVEYKSFVRIKCLDAMREAGIDLPHLYPGTGYRVDIVAFKQPPKAFSKKKLIAALKGELMPTTKPDLDNVAKIILDALTGILWRDDKEVSTLFVSKVFAEKPMVKVVVSWKEEAV